MSQQTGVPFLGSIPIDPEVGIDSDKGTPFVLSHKESAAAKAFMEIVENSPVAFIIRIDMKQSRILFE